MNQITKNIKHAMIDANITSERKLAESIGMKKSTMNVKMQNGGPWKPAEREAIAKATGKTEEELFEEGRKTA